MAVADVAVSNVPEPLVVHVADEAPPPYEPAIVAVLLEQITWSGPALTVAAGLIVKIMVSFTAEHGPVGSLVV